MHDPPANVVLGRDEKGKKRDQTWNYRSVIGMMIYLAATSRLDMFFAIHQFARVCSNPTRSHEEAIKGSEDVLRELGTKE